MNRLVKFLSQFFVAREAPNDLFERRGYPPLPYPLPPPPAAPPPQEPPEHLRIVVHAFVCSYCTREFRSGAELRDHRCTGIF